MNGNFGMSASKFNNIRGINESLMKELGLIKSKIEINKKNFFSELLVVPETTFLKD
jgi:hypothetical protein